MPVTFATAEPFDARLLAEYGQRAAADRAAGDRLRQAQLRTQQLGIGLETANRAAAVDAGVYERQDRAQEFAALQRPSERDLFFSHQQMVMQRSQQAEAVERAQLAAWVSQQNMTYQEQVRLKRDEAAVGHILSDQDLSPAEQREYVRELRTGIDAGKKRLQDTQQRMMDARAKEDMAQAERMSQATALAGKIQAMTTPDRIHWVIDPGTEADLTEQVVAEWHKAGLPAGLQPPAAEVAAEVTRRASRMGLAKPAYLTADSKLQEMKWGAEGKDKGEAKDQFGRTPQDYDKAVRDAQVRVDKYIADREAAHAKAYPEPEGRPALEKVDREAMVDQELARGKWGRTIEDHFGRGGQTPPAPGAPAAQGGGGPAPAPGPEQPKPPPKPFDFADPKTQTPQQQKQVAHAKVMADRAAALPEKPRAEVARRLRVMTSLLAHYGSLDAAPAETRAEFMRVATEAAEILRKGEEEAKKKKPAYKVGDPYPLTPFGTPTS